MQFPRLFAQLTAALEDLSFRSAVELLMVFAGLNFLWEVAQLPLYDIWYEASLGSIAFAVLYCTV